MSYDESKLKLCTLTSFYSPYLFWLVFHDDIPSRKILQKDLNHPNANYAEFNEKNTIGELVIVHFEDDWVRGEIVQIRKNFKLQSITFSCFLLDYGRIVSTTKVFKLPKQYYPNIVPPSAYKGILYGLTPSLTLHHRKQTEWLPGIRVLVESVVSNNILQKFYIEKESMNVVVGDVILESQGEKCSLSKEIIGRNFAGFDPEYDVTQIVERPLSQIHYMIVYLIGLKPTKLDSKAITNRSLEAMTKNMFKPFLKIRDDYFEDIDKVLSNNPNTDDFDACGRGRAPRPSREVKGQRFSKDLTQRLKKTDIASSLEEDHKKFADAEKIAETVRQNMNALNLVDLETLPEPLGRGRSRNEQETFREKEKRSRSVGRNFKMTDNSEIESSNNQKIKSILKKKSPEPDLKLKTSGRGYKLCQQLTSARELRKLETENVPIIGGRGKPVDFDTEDNTIISGRGFRKTTNSESENDLQKPENFVKKSSGRGLILSRISPNKNVETPIKSETESDKDSPKTTGRGQKLLAKLKKSDTESDSSIGRSFQSTKSKFDYSDEQFQDAKESSCDSKKSIFRDSSVEEVDGMAAGSTFICPKKVNAENFQNINNPKRPPENIDKLDFDPKHEKETRWKKKKVSGFCECSTCEGWRNNECVFKNPEEEIQVKKQKKDIPKVIEKPCLLFKTDDEVITVPFQNNRHFRSETEKFAAPRILVHSCFSVSAIYDLPLISFHEDVQRALRSLNYSNAHSIQVYTWSAILRGDSAIIVSVPDCGKTMVYVPALCTFLYHKRPELSKKSGPQSIILCPRVSVVEDVYRLFKSIFKRINKDHKIMSIPFYNKHVSKQNDIIVTTPRILIKLYKDDVISFQRLCHIVLEDGHDLFALFPKEINYIMNKINNVLENRTCLIPIQVITITQEWNMKIENFAKKFKYPPLICVGAHLEAALYGRANIKVQLSNEDEKPEKVINLIKDVYKDSKTLILCNDIQIPRSLLSLLEDMEIPYETLLLNSVLEEINGIKRKWMTAVPQNYFVLVCSDNIFNTGLAITDAEVIVQYSLPENWSQFTFRFSGFLDNYSSPINTSAENMKKTVMHIIMDNVNIKPYPKLLHFLQRMNTKITDVMLSIYENLQLECEKEKLNNEISLCEKFLCFDACNNFSSCKYRHLLSPKIDISPTLPKSGLIKLKVLHVESPVKYSCRLIKHTDSTNITHEINDFFALIATQLLSVRDKLQLVPANRIKVGLVCAVKEMEGISKGNFQRGRILEDVVMAGFNKKVLVRFIDLGFDQLVNATQIYQLPNYILEHPPQSVTVYIADIAPLDYDTTWAYTFMTNFKREFRKYGYSRINCYFTGRIKLQLGEALFVDDLKLQELIEDDSIIIHKMSVCDTLKYMEGIEKIPRMQKLYELCEKSKIPLQNYNLPEIKVENKAKPQAKPQWAHLENLQEFNQVYFVSAIDPSSFFVRLSQNIPLLEQLHRDIKKAMEKPHFPSVVEAVEGQCYTIYDSDEDIYARVQITKIKSNMVDCFFVDYGDRNEVNKQELKFLPDEFITKLPFQAIECKLYGIEPVDDSCSVEITDIFYEIANEPNSDILRYLYVKIMDKEPAQYTGYKKYSVILLDIFKYNINVNNVLVKQGLALSLTDDPIEIDFDKLKDSIAQKVVSAEEENIEEIVKDDNINFEDDKWDIFINNPEDFFAGLNLPITKINKSEENPEKVNENRFEYSKMKALPAVDYSTPDIVWQQTATHVTFKIHIPSVENYETQLARHRIFKFKTEFHERKYEVKLIFFANIEHLEHSNMGLYILVKMKKCVEQEWPRLIFSKEKMRNIKYNVVSIPVDEESDDEKPLSEKMIQSSKTLGTELNKILEDENAPCVFEYGSDIDWDESDIESERDSDES